MSAIKLIIYGHEWVYHIHKSISVFFSITIFKFQTSVKITTTFVTVVHPFVTVENSDFQTVMPPFRYCVYIQINTVINL